MPSDVISTPFAISTGTDYWIGITSDTNNVKLYISGTLVSTLSVPMRRFSSVALTEYFGDTNGDYAGEPADGTPYGAAFVLDVKQERMWNRVLSLAELTAEAASSTPISTSGLVSNTGLSSMSDLTDTVGGHNFSATNATWPPTSSGGYVHMDTYPNGISRSGRFAAMGRPFSKLFHIKGTGTSTNYREIWSMIPEGPLAVPPGWPFPWIWFGTDNAVNNLILEVSIGTTTTTPIDPSVECCDTVSGGGTNAGDVKRPADPSWTSSCTGGGSVATAADLTVSEDWSA